MSVCRGSGTRRSSSRRGRPAEYLSDPALRTSGPFVAVIPVAGIISGGSTLTHRSHPSCSLSGLLTAPSPRSGSSRISTAARLEFLPAPARARVVATDSLGFRTDGRGAGVTLRLRIGDVGGHPCGPTGTNDEGGNLGLLPRSDPLEVECFGVVAGPHQLLGDPFRCRRIDG